MEDNWEAAEAVVFGFMQACFARTLPDDAQLDPHDKRWVLSALERSETLSPADVFSWPSGKQLALRVTLTNTLIGLRLLKPGFAKGDLQGSSSHALAQPLMTAIAVLSEAVPA